MQNIYFFCPKAADLNSIDSHLKDEGLWTIENKKCTERNRGEAVICVRELYMTFLLSTCTRENKHPCANIQSYPHTQRTPVSVNAGNHPYDSFRPSC